MTPQESEPREAVVAALARRAIDKLSAERGGPDSSGAEDYDIEELRAALAPAPLPSDPPHALHWNDPDCEDCAPLPSDTPARTTVGGVVHNHRYHENPTCGERLVGDCIVPSDTPADGLDVGRTAENLTRWMMGEGLVKVNRWMMTGWRETMFDEGVALWSAALREYAALTQEPRP